MVDVAGSIVSGSPVSAACSVPPAAGTPVAAPPLGPADELDDEHAVSTAPRLDALSAAALNPAARRRNDRRDRSPFRKLRAKRSARCSSLLFRSMVPLLRARDSGVLAEPSQVRPVELRRVLPHRRVTPPRRRPVRPGDALLQSFGE